MESEIVTVKSFTSVYPDAKGESLSNIDRKCPMLMHTIFFHSTALHDFESVVQKMKWGTGEDTVLLVPSSWKALHKSREWKIQQILLAGRPLLRSAFRSNSGSMTDCSVVTTHLWKARNKALNFNKERKACLQFTGNLRNKLVPPLSEAFSGNADVLAFVLCTVGDLEKESLEETICKIKAAQESVADDYVRRHLEALDAPQVSLPPLMELAMVKDLSMCPFHKLDFGQGRPTCNV